MTITSPPRALRGLLDARACPDCGRILFPTREANYPHHYGIIKARIWCPTSGYPVFRGSIGAKSV